MPQTANTKVVAQATAKNNDFKQLLLNISIINYCALPSLLSK